MISRLIFTMLAVVTFTATSASAKTLKAADLPTILALDSDQFDKQWEGRLFTARLIVNDLTPGDGFYAVGFTEDGEQKTFPPVSCKLVDRGEVALAVKGKQLWVSGILSNKLGSTLFLEPCQISYTAEPNGEIEPWKKHPPRE